jgi:hypothetical protein
VTASQFFQRNRIWLLVVAALLLVYSNGARISAAIGVPYIKEGAFAVTLAVLLWFAFNMFSAMSVAMKQHKQKGAHE